MRTGKILTLLSLGLVVSLVAASSAVAETPLPAKDALATTIAKSKDQHKVVFLAFHASWCGWCHRLEDFLNAPNIKPIIAKHINVLWLDCMEQPDKKTLENPGVDAIMEQYDATKTGLPTMFIIDGDGKTIASSIKEKTGNIGYPGEPDEITHFLGMMKKAGLNQTELNTLDIELKARAAKLKTH